MRKSNKIIKIGDKSFKNKTELKKYIKEILYAYEIGSNIFKDDIDFLLNLIQFHPQAKQKIGCGIAYFTIGQDPIWKKTRCFILHRIDYSYTDFSFHSCIDGCTYEKRALSACRSAISNQIIFFKSNLFRQQENIICPIENIPLNKDNCHVDHKPPLTFDYLLFEWLKKSNISLSNIKVSPSSDNNYQVIMIDEKQKKDWQKYHKDNAVLRLISKHANLSILKNQCQVAKKRILRETRQLALIQEDTSWVSTLKI